MHSTSCLLSVYATQEVLCSSDAPMCSNHLDKFFSKKLMEVAIKIFLCCIKTASGQDSSTYLTIQFQIINVHLFPRRT